MPELPEVHTTATQLRRLIIGHTIIDVWSDYDSQYFYGKEQIKDPAYFKMFKKKIIGSTVIDTGRIGKNVLLHLNNNQTIVVHMKMTGHLLYGSYAFTSRKKEWLATEPGPLRDDKWNGFIRLIFVFDNGKHLALSDLRKFAKVMLVETNQLDTHNDLKDMGPDPLQDAFTFSVFKHALEQKTFGKIKQVIMDQSVIAGVGNIYSDEALWLSHIHPETVVRNLDDTSLKKLFAAIKKVLKKGIDFKGDSTSDYRTPSGEPGSFHHMHHVYRRTKQQCTRKKCNGIIQRIVVGGRSAHFCALCQKKK